MIHAYVTKVAASLTPLGTSTQRVGIGVISAQTHMKSELGLGIAGLNVKRNEIRNEGRRGGGFFPY